MRTLTDTGTHKGFAWSSRVLMAALVAVALGGCEAMPLPGRTQIPARTQDIVPPEAAPGQAAQDQARAARDGVARSGEQAPGSYSASGGVGPEVAARRPNAPVARPPLLPSLEDLIGRIPQATTPMDETGAVIDPPLLPDARGLRVAVLLPLSGANQRVGAAMLNAAQIALFEFAGTDFEVLVQDTEGSASGAAQAARLAIADGAELIIGPLLSASVRAVADLARAASVPVVAFSSDRTVAGGGVYTMGFFPGDEVRRVIRYAIDQGAQRFALLAPQDAYGDAVAGAFNAAVTDAGGVVVQSEFYNPQQNDFSEPVKRIAHFDRRRQALLEQRKALRDRGGEVAELALKRLKNLETLGDVPFDALLLADGGKRLIAVAALLPFFDIDPKKVKILGTGQWDEDGLGVEPALVGGWFAAPDPGVRQAFSDKYLSVYGNRPHRLATLAYDATALAVVLGVRTMSQEQPQQVTPYSDAVLAQSGGFAGRDGLFRFLPSGVAERGLAVLQVRRRAAVIVDPAPVAFP